MSNLAQADYLILAVYFILVIAIGAYVAAKTRSSTDLFLAGRKLGWKSIGFSLFASNISSTTLVGLAGTAYATGLAVANYELVAALVLVFLAVYYVPVYLNSKINTIPEFLEKRFNRSCRLYFSAITIFLSIAVDTAGGIYAGSMVMQSFFPELEVWHICVGLGVFAGLYTIAGGLAAVVYTDMIQAVVLLIGSLAISYCILAEFDFSWSLAIADLPSGHLTLLRPMEDKTLPWLGALVGVPVLGFWYWVTNQYVVQRVLGARSVEDARLGSILAGFLKLLPLFLMVLPGALAIKLFPDLQNHDMVFPTMIKELLPVGWVGLVLAGLISAILSSIDSTLNSASALVCFDFLGIGTGPKAVKAGRLTTLILLAIALIWSPFIGNLGGLFQYLQQVFCIFVPPIAAIFIVAVFQKSGSGRTAFTTMLLGQVFSALLFVGHLMEFISLHYTILVGISFGFSLFVFNFLAFLEETEEAPDTKLLVTKKAKTSRPLFLDYRFYSLFILAIVGLIVGVFR